VIRFLAPLTIPDSLLKDGCKLLEQALHEATESLGRGSTTSTTAQPA
jgi:hypothetical protein